MNQNINPCRYIARLWNFQPGNQVLQSLIINLLCVVCLFVVRFREPSFAWPLQGKPRRNQPIFLPSTKGSRFVSLLMLDTVLEDHIGKRRVCFLRPSHLGITRVTHLMVSLCSARRHVQAVCCEVQKLLFVLKYGRPAQGCRSLQV